MGMQGFLEDAEVEEVHCFQRIGHDLIGERFYHQFDVNLIYHPALGQNEELVKECFDDLSLLRRVDADHIFLGGWVNTQKLAVAILTSLEDLSEC